jgi:hypothetical protein
MRLDAETAATALMTVAIAGVGPACVARSPEFRDQLATNGGCSTPPDRVAHPQVLLVL